MFSDKRLHVISSIRVSSISPTFIAHEGGQKEARRSQKVPQSGEPRGGVAPGGGGGRTRRFTGATDAVAPAPYRLLGFSRHGAFSRFVLPRIAAIHPILVAAPKASLAQPVQQCVLHGAGEASGALAAGSLVENGGRFVRFGSCFAGLSWAARFGRRWLFGECPGYGPQSSRVASTEVPKAGLRVPFDQHPRHLLPQQWCAFAGCARAL